MAQPRNYSNQAARRLKPGDHVVLDGRIQTLIAVLVPNNPNHAVMVCTAATGGYVPADPIRRRKALHTVTA